MDKKISELPAATVPLAGTEKFEILQGGVNKQVDASDVGGGGSVASVTGENNAVDITDPANPIVRNSKRIVAGADASVIGDNKGLIILNSATPFNFTLDSLAQWTEISFENIGAGAVTFINGAGVTAAGNLVLPGASGTMYPTALVIYETTTTPRVAQGSIKLYDDDALGTNDDGAPTQGNVKAYVDLRTIDSVAVATNGGAGSTVTLNMALKYQRMFVGDTVFGGTRTIAFSNTTNALVIDFHYEIDNVAAVITWPSTVICGDSRWSSGGKTITHTVIGKFEASLTYNGTNWVLKVSQALT